MRRVASGVVFAAGLVAGCGGVEISSRGASGSGGAPGSAGASGDGATGGGLVLPDGGSIALDPGGAVYVDPKCPPQPKVQGPRECDAYAAETGCAPDEACVPYIGYADKCEPEEIGTRCELAGTGVQGDDCSGDGNQCAAGFVCVSAGSGFVCAALCTTTGARDDCPPGLICGPLDVDGFFVCG